MPICYLTLSVGSKGRLLGSSIQGLTVMTISVSAWAWVSSEGSTGEGSLPKCLFMSIGKIQLRRTIGLRVSWLISIFGSASCRLLQSGSLLYQSQKDIESTTKMKFTYPYNLITEMTFHHLNWILQTRNKSQIPATFK
jgi:hypothetical protein